MRIDQLDTKGGFNLPRRFIGPGDRSLLEEDFESALAAMPNGYGEGVYDELRHGVTVQKSRDGKRTNLFARALAGRL